MQRLLKSAAPDMQVLAVLDSVAASIEWFKKTLRPIDIHGYSVKRRVSFDILIR